MSTPELFADFAEAVGSDSEFCRLLPHHDQLNPQIVLWLCWLDRRNQRLAPSGLHEALAIVAGDNMTLLTHLRAAESNISGPARFTRVQQNLMQKHISAARAALERVLQQRLQDLTPRLPAADDDAQDALSLFEYFTELKLDNPAATATGLLEITRSRTLDQVAIPLVQPHF